MSRVCYFRPPQFKVKWKYTLISSFQRLLPPLRIRIALTSIFTCAETGTPKYLPHRYCLCYCCPNR